MTPSASSPDENDRETAEEAHRGSPASAPSNSVPIQRLDAHHADAAAATLSEAFFDDPLLQILSPDEAKRQRRGNWFMSMTVQYGLRWGEVWAADDTSAAAVWLPPGSTDMSLGRMLRVGLTRMPVQLGLSGSCRFMKALSATEPFHKSVSGPHWYLLAVGARTDRQGQGLGSALAEVGTSQADAAGVPCYLETGTQSNIEFYTKRGFEIVGQTSFEGHTLTGMVRQPTEGSAT